MVALIILLILACIPIGFCYYSNKIQKEYIDIYYKYIELQEEHIDLIKYLRGMK